MTSPEEIARILSNSDTWVILAHEKPDGDTIGCGSALFQRGILEGKKCFWGGKDPMPSLFSFLPFAGSYQQWENFPDGIGTHTAGTAVIALDTSNLERSINDLYPAALEHQVLNIDHHADNSGFGSHNWIEEEAASVGEMIYHLYSVAGWTISAGEAEAIFVAISTDTGFFRFSSTTGKTFKIASFLLDCGVDPSSVYKSVYENRTLAGLHLWGVGLSRASLFADGRGCLTFLESRDFLKNGAQKDESENLVNYLLSVSGVLVAVLVQEENGCCRASLRTRDPVNARSIAEIWGGGGHIRAAGFKIQKDLLSAKIEIIQKIGGNLAGWISCN